MFATLHFFKQASLIVQEYVYNISTIHILQGLNTDIYWVNRMFVEYRCHEPQAYTEDLT